MRRLAASTVIGIAIVVIGGAAYFVGRQPPILSAPISIADASALADGGSLHLVLQASDGRQFAIGVSGNLGPKSEFGVYVQPLYRFAPVPLPIRKGSSEEAALLTSVEGWQSQLAVSQPGAELLLQIANVLRSRSERRGA